MKERIDRIIVDDREVLSLHDIINSFWDFYSNLFSSEVSPNFVDIRYCCMTLIPTNIFEEDSI